jgi:hypothetical protein
MPSCPNATHCSNSPYRSNNTDCPILPKVPTVQTVLTEHTVPTVPIMQTIPTGPTIPTVETDPAVPSVPTVSTTPTVPTVPVTTVPTSVCVPKVLAFSGFQSAQYYVLRTYPHPNIYDVVYLGNVRIIQEECNNQRAAFLSRWYSCWWCNLPF